MCLRGYTRCASAQSPFKLLWPCFCPNCVISVPLPGAGHRGALLHASAGVPGSVLCRFVQGAAARVVGNAVFAVPPSLMRFVRFLPGYDWMCAAGLLAALCRSEPTAASKTEEKKHAAPSSTAAASSALLHVAGSTAPMFRRARLDIVLLLGSLRCCSARMSAVAALRSSLPRMFSPTRHAAHSSLAVRLRRRSGHHRAGSSSLPKFRPASGAAGAGAGGKADEDDGQASLPGHHVCAGCHRRRAWPPVSVCLPLSAVFHWLLSFPVDPCSQIGRSPQQKSWQVCVPSSLPHSFLPATFRPPV